MAIKSIRPLPIASIAPKCDDWRNTDGFQNDRNNAMLSQTALAEHAGNSGLFGVLTVAFEVASPRCA